MKYLITIAGLFCVIMFLGFYHVDNEEQQPTGYLHGYDVRIVDGDTIELEGQKVRLAEIDAPEMKQNCVIALEAYNCGLEARRQLMTLTQKRWIVCDITDGNDRYGRLLGHCYRKDDKLNINQHMVRSGWAVEYKTGGPYYSDERYAENNSLGLHEGLFEHPKLWRKR